ncbi:DUF3108 domain-containing protein [Puniceicoccus vermicola]|uniref:DUF3108 domain-containing protein n=1 Tax=Puniceicoccus vermicola TaxID=388746 RepID=A0A7X1E7R5_9BACT|nr:DUF3108 domain-containing protein [Puniceicoccus vermicola]MBC2604012.1 DUF3108 domain-containing protein [Puniceicoccus vermicola]
MKLRLLYLFLGVLCLGISQSSALEPNFRPGEALRYDLKWSVFQVGYARLQVHDLEEYQGEPAWHFSFHVRTNSFADKFFKVRTRIDTWVSEDLTRTLYYKEKKREGKTKRDIEVTFDWDKMEATYANHGKKKEPVALPEGPVLDPVGAVYYFRSIPPVKGSTYTFAVTDGKKAVAISLPINNEEKIKVEAGHFNTFKIQPQTGELGGVFEKSSDSEVNLWFTSDRLNYPVQVQGEVTVGSFWAELTKIEWRTPEELD